MSSSWEGRLSVCFAGAEAVGVLSVEEAVVLLGAVVAGAAVDVGVVALSSSSSSESQAIGSSVSCAAPVLYSLISTLDILRIRG